MQKEISELLKYRRSIRDVKYLRCVRGQLISFIWLWHNYPIELGKYARKYIETWDDGLCLRCGAHKASYKEMMGEECCK